MTVQFPPDRLEAFAAKTLTAVGLTKEHSRITAARMLDADLRGRSAHGIFRLPAYVRRVRAGGYNLRPAIHVVQDTPAVALIDGDNGFGQVVVTTATEIAARKARTAGLAWVGTRKSNHAGAGGVYAAMLATEGLVCLYAAVANANHMAPWSGVEPLLGTNPIAIGVPTGSGQPVVIDIATSSVSYGAVKETLARGEPMPEGWMIDRKGNPLTDPARSAQGLLVPIGGHKGYGLALAVGLLAGVLNGAAFGRQVVDFNANDVVATNTGQMIIALDPGQLANRDSFLQAVDAHLADLRASTPLPGGEVRIPGDAAGRTAARLRAEGIELPNSLLEELRTLAAELDLTDRLLG